MRCHFLQHYSNHDFFMPFWLSEVLWMGLLQEWWVGLYYCLNDHHTVRVRCPVNGLVDSCGWVSQRWWAVNGERELCKWKPGCCCSVGKSVGHLNIQPQGQLSNSFPLNMPHKEKGSDKMARSAQARICILMCLSESLWIRAVSMRDHTTPRVGTKQPIIAAAQKITTCVRRCCKIGKERINVVERTE